MKPKTRTLNLREFLERGRDTLALTVVTGEDLLDRTVQEASLNRPGLMLAGFSQYFANKRIQVFGLAENAFLASLTPAERDKRLRLFFGSRVPAVIQSRNRRPLPELVDLAREFETPLLRSPLVTHRLINEATLLMDHLVAPMVRLSGTTVDILGIGVMLRGAHRIGKSETALGLIEKGHSLVADDVTVLRRVNRQSLMASAVKVTRFHMEVSGVGIIHVPSLYGVASVRSEKLLDLIIELYMPSADDPVDHGENASRSEALLDVTVPVVRIPVLPGRDMAKVVELVALNHRLHTLGHDAEKELDVQIVNALTRMRGLGE